MARISCKGIVCTQNQKSFYVAVMDSQDLKNMCFVSRKKEDPERGFQRLLSERRAKDIAYYLDEERGVIPPALILSAQPIAKLHYDDKKMLLTMERTREALLVLDGQHRLYGLNRAQNNYQMPVVIFESLNSQEEVRQFIDINTTQKGVPTALLLDIKSQAGTETKIEERQRILFDSLSKDSVLAGYLLPNESKVGKISRTTFNQATKAIFEGGPLAEFSDDVIYKAVRNYLSAVDSVFKRTGSTDARLTKNILFKVIMLLFNDACDKCASKYGNLRTTSFEEYLMPLAELDYSQYEGTNKTTEHRIEDDMRSVLRERIILKEDVF